MKIIQLTPGAGGMYCGGCMRDNALVAGLRKLGHDALLVPLYLPLQIDEDDMSSGSPLFFGGVNVYLQHKSAVFRKTPAWVDRAFDTPGLLRWAGRMTGSTKPEDLGSLTVSMLRGESGNQAKELEKLVRWLKDDARPDVVCLSNLLLVGMARRIKEALRGPVVCSLHGEDYFLNALPAPHGEAAWKEARTRAAEVDCFIAVSRYYGDVMRSRLGLREEQLKVVHNGIALDGYTPAETPPEHPTLGYFARLCPEKGLATLIDAFLLIKEAGRLPGLRLRIGGSLSPGDEAFVEAQREKLAKAGIVGDVEIAPNLDRAQKLAFYRSLTVFSVPATYGEAFGLFVLEALAAGVPVVLPRHGAFPELVEALGGGKLCAPDDPNALADVIVEVAADRARARALGEAGRKAVRAGYTVEHMARNVAAVLQATVSAPRRVSG
ncbi:MAG: glycosyltransferase family 4 protein [Planctomycetes bacterium]|nr:glycosyltransferase family 4 protein [Planctomycetota bacterium]